MDELEKTIYKYALLNAIKHKGNGNPGAVMGAIMSSEPDLRKDAKKIGPISGKLVAKVNQMSLEEQESEITKLGVDLNDQKSKEKSNNKEKGLTDLPGSHDGIVMRFAPNPSGPLHIGHARAAVPNAEYVKRYNGKLILRIEDTDPKRIYPPAYDMIPEDLHWLGIEFNEIYYQSDRFPIYYEYAEKLIKIGAAYMCTCDGGDFKKLKDECESCPCRGNSPEENMELWKEFPTMKSGQAVLRVKTDINHKNPAIRDWVAMRIVDEEHPRIGTKYRIYPMMNFSVAIDDHLMGMSHVLRGKDHLANSEKQKYLYEHMGWDIPKFIHYGRLKMEDIALSTSKALNGIETGEYSGWDDPRLGTLRAIARRGIQAKTLHDLMIEIGVKMSDSAISWKKIYGLNRNILEEKANRYFFVPNPKKIEIVNLTESLNDNLNDNLSENSDKNSFSDDLNLPETIERPLHPDYLDRGNRKLVFDGEVYIPSDDLNDGITRLMDAVNINIKSNNISYDSKSFEEAREKKARIIQWVPANDNIKAKIVMSDASIVEGVCEASCKDLKIGDIVQFERFGFARLDEISNNELVFYFAHK
ncbi:glutamate--tRNA ligase [Methanobrevibacter sp. TMH8]|uniref:glutamate--tRNA ligase n=1 Tax=Methanobrevibacter sp. TMH8 TaxID=2848611 RepID=UPI001CCD7951|nr:glutamate--tRNA ligase [Methanobrevibacter sp. TMH8]MBZ9571556.1 glutamate--tRNA ligase [Methanobrevibacter sp. TMH8]